eukprot:TRINITY_DN2017_c0_g2_i1.p1 TRINITY_DN2017_c0_g2~~TRINITY_DN2017_c0_g2_i1.p1  ORF type:complete len:243 (+),score=33.25 TRINITY_DN2017_c0_g2_i1:79-807(+)
MELQVFVKCFDVIVPVSVSHDGKVKDIVSQLGEEWACLETEQGQPLENESELCDTTITADDMLVAVERMKFFWNESADDFFEATGMPKGIINYNCFKVKKSTIEKSSMQNKTFCFSAMPGIPEGSYQETIRIRLSGLKSANSRQQQFDGIGILSTLNCGFLSCEGVRYRPCDGAILSGRSIVGNLPPASEGTTLSMTVLRTFSSTFVTFTMGDHSFTVPWDPEGVLYPTVQVEQVGSTFTIL